MKTILVLAAMVIVPAQAISGEMVSADPDAAYQAAMEVALDIGAMPSTSNDKLRFFKTDAMKLKPTAEQADCGSMFGIPHVKDDRTVVEVAYTVRVKPAEAGSELDVSTTLVGYYDESRNAISNFMADKKRDQDDLLDCKSTGAFEREFAARVQAKLR